MTVDFWVRVATIFISGGTAGVFWVRVAHLVGTDRFAIASLALYASAGAASQLLNLYRPLTASTFVVIAAALAGIPYAWLAFHGRTHR